MEKSEHKRIPPNVLIKFISEKMNREARLGLSLKLEACARAILYRQWHDLIPDIVADSFESFIQKCRSGRGYEKVSRYEDHHILKVIYASLSRTVRFKCLNQNRKAFPSSIRISDIAGKNVIASDGIYAVDVDAQDMVELPANAEETMILKEQEALDNKIMQHLRLCARSDEDLRLVIDSIAPHKPDPGNPETAEKGKVSISHIHRKTGMSRNKVRRVLRDLREIEMEFERNSIVLSKVEEKP